MKSVFPGLIFWFVVPFIESVKFHFTYLTCTARKHGKAALLFLLTRPGIHSCFLGTFPDVAGRALLCAVQRQHDDQH